MALERRKRSATSSSYNNKSKLSNRIHLGTDVSNPAVKYPWEALIINNNPQGLISACDQTSKQFFRDNPPDELNYIMCAGSLITNQHVLTSAECLLSNRELLVDNMNVDKIRAEYIEPKCIFVFLGITDKEAMIDDGNFYKVKKHHVHYEAFTAINKYNYNLGKGLHCNAQCIDCI